MENVVILFLAVMFVALFVAGWRLFRDADFDYSYNYETDTETGIEVVVKIDNKTGRVLDD